MNKLLAGLLESKRFRVFILGKIAAIVTALSLLALASFGVEDVEVKKTVLELAKELPALILGGATAWVAFQSATDMGKGKAEAVARIEASLPRPEATSPEPTK